MREPTTGDRAQAAVADETADIGLAEALVDSSRRRLVDAATAVAASASSVAPGPCLQGKVGGIGGGDGADRAARDERLDTLARETEGVVGCLEAAHVPIPMSQVSLTRQRRR